MLAVGVALATGLLLAGCASNGQTPNDAPTTPAARATSPAPSTPPAAASTPSEASTPATSAPATPPASASTTPAGTGAGPVATPGSGATGGSSATGASGLRSVRCRSANLRGAITTGDGGAAGSLLPYLVLTNTGSSACTLQGWPGVSLVGGGNGTQIGASATLDRTSEHATVTLLPRGSAHVPMRITQAANYPTATCNPTPADGFRVYPPGSRTSLYVAAPGYTGCANTAVELLSVRAVQPGAA